MGALWGCPVRFSPGWTRAESHKKLPGGSKDECDGTEATGVKLRFWDLEGQHILLSSTNYQEISQESLLAPTK